MLSFSLDEGQMTDVAQEFAASDKQIRYSYGVALRRTAETIRKSIVPGLKTELGLKNAKLLRKRIKLAKQRGANRMSAKIWVGTWGFPYSEFKGKAVRTPNGIRFGDDHIIGGFQGTSMFTKKKELFVRKGKDSHPIKMQRRPIHEQTVVYLEDNVFVDVNAIFQKKFAHEIKARTIYKVGRSQ